MSTRARLPHRIEKRRKGALERRMHDAEKYSENLSRTPADDRLDQQLDIAKQDVHNLRKKLGLLKDTE